MGIATINPATGETLQTFEALTDTEIETKLALAQSSFKQYRQTPMQKRADWLNAAAEILESDRERFGK
ncbi:aldehyde dehydrogenase family protein, partial [Coleofasciculus sp. FACHB-712]